MCIDTIKFPIGGRSRNLHEHLRSSWGECQWNVGKIKNIMLAIPHCPHLARRPARWQTGHWGNKESPASIQNLSQWMHLAGSPSSLHKSSAECQEMCQWLLTSALQLCSQIQIAAEKATLRGCRMVSSKPLDPYRRKLPLWNLLQVTSCKTTGHSRWCDGCNTTLSYTPEREIRWGPVRL